MANAHILTINAGSSSLKFALFQAKESPSRALEGKFDRVGLPHGELRVNDLRNGKKETRQIDAPNHADCVASMMELLGDEKIAAIGHRVVHGGRRYYEPQRVTSEMLMELRQLSLFAPDHLPSEITLMEELARRYADVPQIA